MRSDTRQRQAARVIGILAGGGELPREIAASLAARGVPVVVVAVEGEADADWRGFEGVRLGWGKVGRMLATFRNAGVRDVVIAGKVRRPDLKTLRPDLGFILGLPEIVALIARGGGDDRVLRGIIRFFERRGLRVLGIDQVAPHLIVGRGLLGRVQATSGAVADMGLAASLLTALAPFDIGQGVIAAEGRIEAVEAAENTDAMLRRVAARRRAEKRAHGGGVLVKLVKRGQERRIDLPAVGAQTVVEAVAAGLSGIGFEAGGVVAVRREDMIARADAAGLFLAGIDPPPAPRPPAARSPASPLSAAPSVGPPLTTAAAAEGDRRADAAGWRVVGGGRAAARLMADASRGAEVQAAAAPFGVGGAVVVSRRHVLGVEAGEGTAALLARVAGLRQWGTQGSRRPAGVLALADAAALTPEVLASAAEAGLAAIALSRAGGDEDQRLTALAASSVASRGGRRMIILVRPSNSKETAR